MKLRILAGLMLNSDLPRSGLGGSSSPVVLTMLDLPLQPVDICTRGVVAKVSEAKVENRGPPRKLTTILCADVAGYARLMHLDEEGTFQKLQACRAMIDR